MTLKALDLANKIEHEQFVRTFDKTLRSDNTRIAL